MAVTKESLEEVLREKLSANYVVATDTSGKTLLQKHQMVNNAAKAEIAALHAFSQKTYTPAQWEEQNGTS